MKIGDASQLLQQDPAPLEDGFKTLDDGMGFVAVRTEMPGCSSEMIKWWFSHVQTTEQYKQWHPKDHIWSDWKGPRDTGEYIGGTHLVHERLGGDAIAKLKLNFRDPTTILDAEQLQSADVGVAIYARGGPLNLPLWTGHVLHLVRDTDAGCVMRSRFWLGDVKPAVPLLSGIVRRELTSDDTLSGLHRHCAEEMKILAGFLPDLFTRETTKQKVN
jgi:hypothetical protein